MPYPKNPREWNALREAWKKARHVDTIDADSVRFQEVQDMMTWDAPLERLPPEIIELIFALEERVRKLEDVTTFGEAQLEERIEALENGV